MDQRKSQRVAVEWRCYATTQKLANTKLAVQVEDLSRDGIRFTLDSETAQWKPFTKGDVTSVAVVLPNDHDLGERCIHGQGKVVRVTENGGGVTSVAVSFDRAMFREFRSLTQKGARLKKVSRVII